MQCVQQLHIDTGKPIQQLAVNSSALPSDLPGKTAASCGSNQVLLAVRGPHQLVILQASHATAGQR